MLIFYLILIYRIFLCILDYSLCWLKEFQISSHILFIVFKVSSKKQGFLIFTSSVCSIFFKFCNFKVFYIFCPKIKNACTYIFFLKVLKFSFCFLIFFIYIKLVLFWFFCVCIVWGRHPISFFFINDPFSAPFIEYFFFFFSDLSKYLSHILKFYLSMRLFLALYFVSIVDFVLSPQQYPSSFIEKWHVEQFFPHFLFTYMNLFCARNYSKHFTNINYCNAYQVSTFIFLILQLRKLRHKEIK